jgi:TRAP-type C4-dicarboxylate transport system substrate-binding protein
MNAAELKLDLFRKIDNLKDSELEKLYNMLLVLLNTTTPYKLSKDEKDAIDEALEESRKGKTYTHEEVIEEARSKYPNLEFK